MTGHAWIWRELTRKKPYRWNIGPVITGPMFHRVGCCASHWPHGRDGPFRLLGFAAGGCREPSEGLAWDIWNLAIFLRAGAGVPGLPSATCQVRKSATRAAADHRSHGELVMASGRPGVGPWRSLSTITRAISAIGICSARLSRRISVQSSTLSTSFLPDSAKARVSGKLVTGQFSVASLRPVIQLPPTTPVSMPSLLSALQQWSTRVRLSGPHPMALPLPFPQRTARQPSANAP